MEELAEILQANGINARAYHAGMDSATRTQNQDDFLMEKIDVIVATIAFGMGIDKPDVAMSSITIYPKVWKDITRRPDVPEEMEEKGSVLLSIPIKTCRSSRSLCKANL